MYQHFDVIVFLELTFFTQYDIIVYIDFCFVFQARHAYSSGVRKRQMTCQKLLNPRVQYVQDEINSPIEQTTKISSISNL